MIKSRKMNWREGREACMGKTTRKHKIVTRKPEGKTPFNTHRLRWDDNIKMALNEIT
jgi:hypothetical protein